MCTNRQPTEELNPPDQKEVDQTNGFEERQSLASVTTEKLTVSEDYDMSAVKTKPSPRQPVQPTYRGWKEVGFFSHSDSLTEDDMGTDLLSRSIFFDSYLLPKIYGDWYHNAGYIFVAGLLSWIIGWFKMSMGPLFFLMVATVILYRSSVRS